MPENLLHRSLLHLFRSLLAPAALVFWAGVYAQSALSQAPATPAATVPADAPAPAATPAPPPPPPPPPAAPKKKRKEPPPMQVYDEPTGTVYYFVTLRAETYGLGAASQVDVRISPASAPGPALRGQTSFTGEFQARLAAGDYEVVLEQGSITSRQQLHVDASSNKLILVNMPSGGGGGGQRH